MVIVMCGEVQMNLDENINYDEISPDRKVNITFIPDFMAPPISPTIIFKFIRQVVRCRRRLTCR